MSSDLRHSFRALRRAPGYSAAVILTIAVAMAANSAIFGAVYAVLLNPLPIQGPERLIVGWETNPARQQAVVELSYRNFETWASSNRTLTSAAAFGSSAWPLSLEQPDGPIRLATVGVSTGFFDVLRARPLLGRFFQPEDAQSTQVRPLVLSHRLWRARFGGDRGVVGDVIATGDGPARIVGVAPADLDFPRGVDAWLPVNPVLATVTTIDGFRDIGVLFLIGRLRDDASVAAATTDLDRVAADANASGGLRFGSAVSLTPFLDYHLGPVRAALSWIWIGGAILLVVACGNLAALTLARALQRKREQAVRLALGANATALYRVPILESLLLSLLGGVSGLLLAQWLVSAILGLAPDDVPRLADTAVNMPVIAFTFALSFAAAMAIACAPIWLSKRLAGVTDLNEGTRTTDTRGTARARSLLLGTQVALSVVLMTAAGLMVRSYTNVHRLDVGFVPDRVLTLEVDSGLPGSRYNEWARELIARVEQMPDVQSAGAVNVRPLALGAIGYDALVVLEGQPDTPQSGELNPSMNHLSATPGYFAAMRIRLTQGRFFDEQDRTGAPRVAIVSESTARRLWPADSPLGKRLALVGAAGSPPSQNWRTVVGVVADVRYRGLDDVRLDLYEPAAQSAARAGHIVVRTSRDPVAMAAAVQAEARRMEPRTIVSGITTMQAVIDRARATWTLSVWMFGAFAAVAIVLVCVGLFSSVSLDATKRSKEFALRIALGADTSQIVRAALASTVVHVAASVCIGVVVAIAGSRAMTGLLFGVSPLDPSTYAAVLGLTAMTVVAGCVWPLYRTTRIAPATLLRRE